MPIPHPWDFARDLKPSRVGYHGEVLSIKLQVTSCRKPRQPENSNYLPRSPEDYSEYLRVVSVVRAMSVRLVLNHVRCRRTSLSPSSRPLPSFFNLFSRSDSPHQGRHRQVTSYDNICWSCSCYGLTLEVPGIPSPKRVIVKLQASTLMHQVWTQMGVDMTSSELDTAGYGQGDMDVTSYVIARTLGDMSAITSDKPPALRIVIGDADTEPEPCTPPLDKESKGVLRLAGVSMFSPASSCPPSPTVSCKPLPRE